MGVAAVRAADPAWLLRTLEHVSADLPAAGVKVGMLAIRCDRAGGCGVPADWRRRGFRLCFDPVLRSSSGHELLDPAALRRLHAELLPLVSWITPNWAELSSLTGLKVRNDRTARDGADGCSGKQHPGLYIVATGGDQDEPVDLSAGARRRGADLSGRAG